MRRGSLSQNYNLAPFLSSFPAFGDLFGPPCWGPGPGPAGAPFPDDTDGSDDPSSPALGRREAFGSPGPAAGPCPGRPCGGRLGALAAQEAASALQYAQTRQALLAQIAGLKAALAAPAAPTTGSGRWVPIITPQDSNHTVNQTRPTAYYQRVGDVVTITLNYGASPTSSGSAPSGGLSDFRAPATPPVAATDVITLPFPARYDPSPPRYGAAGSVAVEGAQGESNSSAQGRVSILPDGTLQVTYYPGTAPLSYVAVVATYQRSQSAAP